MLRWLGPRKVAEPPDPDAIQNALRDGEVTDDPLAALATGHRGQKQIYSVTRSVFLPRVSLKSTTPSDTGGGVNPLFHELGDEPSKKSDRKLRLDSPQRGEKSNSSGYGGSHGESVDPLYSEQCKLRDDAVNVLEQNASFVKSIKISGRTGVGKVSLGSSAGTLTTIPEGRVDLPIPKPIWPLDGKNVANYDSIVDDALLLYTSLNYHPNTPTLELDNTLDCSVKDILVELLNGINATMEGKNNSTPEEMLKSVNEKIAASIEALKTCTEEEMRKLCINLSNCRKMNSVLRAFSHSSSSGNSSQSLPEWTGRERTISSDNEDIYHSPSASSSSGFSDYLKDHPNALPVFVHDDLGNVPNGVRNAMIYGTLYRAKSGAKLACRETVPKKCSLRAVNDNKPSVWEQYYGVRAVPGGEVKYVTKPTDVPLFPGGRPEADFTLDVPRSEMLSKRMKEDKKWRFRCRLLTSFLGLVFFLLSVMAVSLMLTRGKRMFGSMM